MPVLALAPGELVDPIMGLQEHDGPSVRERRPDGLEGGVVQRLPDAARADDDAAEVRERGDLLDGGH